MSKYSNKFKLQVVNYYLNGKTSYPETARHFSMQTGLQFKNG